MGPHRLKKRAVCRHDRARDHGDGERQVERVVGRMVDDDTDLQRQVMEAHMRGWGRFDLRAEQGQPLPGFVWREQPATGHWSLRSARVWYEKVRLATNERLCQMA